MGASFAGTSAVAENAVYLYQLWWLVLVAASFKSKLFR